MHPVWRACKECPIDEVLDTDLFLQMNSFLSLRRAFQPCSTVRALNMVSCRLASSSSSDNKTPTAASPSIDAQMKKKIDDYVTANKIAIFIKGEPDAPRKTPSRLALPFSVYDSPLN